MKKTFIYLIIILLIIIGIYFYRDKNNTKEVFNEKNKIFFLQYGVYNNYDNMKNSASNLSDYFYYKDDLGYHVIIGVCENKNIINKIISAYNLKENSIYIKEVLVSNMEFLESLRQYDILVSSLSDSKSIIASEKQILNKYEELVLSSE